MTADNIESALGYTPADEDDIPDVSGFATTQALIQAVSGLGAAIEDKVDKVTGKGLSTNDYTTAEKDKLAGLPSGSELADVLDAKEDVSNKVTSLSSSSTNTQYPSAKCVYDGLAGKQSTLVSGTNIKTINNESLLGSGNITISADISACELLANKVTSISSSSTDTQYPSAKCVYDAIQAGGGGMNASVSGRVLTITGVTVNNRNLIL